MEKPDFMTRIKEPSPELPEPNKNDRTMSKRKNTEIPKQLSKSKKVDENDKSAPRIRYPKRNLPGKNYTEEEIIPDDRYVYCDRCLNEFVDACKIHSPIILADNQVPLRPKNPDRARATVPSGWLVVSSSKIHNGGEGVWALKTLQMDASFACHLCDKMYTVKELYNRHLMVKHCIYDSNSTKQESGTANNAFAECVPTSTDNTAIESKNQKAANRRHKCSTCHKAFPTPSLLKTHSRVHTGDRPFKCTTCHKTFTTLHSLNRHTRTHTGEKPYACDVCRRTFSHAANLTRHKRTHNNVRPYACDVCHKTFTEAGNLTRHMRTHTGEKPYICQHCQRAFSQRINLKKHIKRRHNNGN